MEVSKPLFMLGLRDFNMPKTPTELGKKAVMMELISELLFAKSAPLFTELYDEKLITAELDGSYDVGRGYAHFVIAGESDDPDAVIDRIWQKLELLKREPPTREDFERVRRVHYAEFIRLFDSTEEIGDAFIRHLFSDNDLLAFTDIIDSVTYEDTVALLNEFFSKEASSVAVVFPIEK
jgi:predicted Zn-dependent peptidase